MGNYKKQNGFVYRDEPWKVQGIPDGLDALTRHCEILMQKLEIKSKGCRDVETMDGRVKKRTKISCEV